MIITEIDLQCEDIRWFGIDINNYVFTCTSAGIANVPAFVCDNKENTMYLENFFISYIKKLSGIQWMKPFDMESAMYQETVNLTSKGIYCYDACDNNDETSYCKISEPISPLILDELPNDIKERLLNNKVEVDVITDNYITVENAY